MSEFTVGRTQADPASRAILYLQSQQSATDGSIPSSAGSYGPSELYAIAAAAAGYDPNGMRAGSGPSVVSYLATHAADACSLAGKCGELIQAVVAAGKDPRAFGDRDLVATLMSQYHSSTGAFGDGQAFTQALAVQGLVAAHAPVPPAALTYIRQAQNTDGGWDYLDKRNDTNPNDFASSDTNSTAMSLMALDATRVHSNDGSALSWLHAQQDGDAGFPYQGGGGSDPDSTALVVQAILATGGDVNASGWIRNGHTPQGYLVATQAADGGYTFPGNTSPDAFTTSQVPLALLQQPLPAAGTYAGGFTPAAEAHAGLQTLLYLQAQQASSGGFTGVSATYDPSELYAIGAAAAGYDPRTLRHGGSTVIDFLGTHAQDACSSAGRCGRLIQAVEAAGLDPHSFGGRDLVGTLQSTYRTGTGAYGDGQAFTQTLAIQGLVAGGIAPPAKAVAFLKNAQDSDGGWDYLDIRNDPNPNDFASSDTNSTAMALMALAAAGDHSRDAGGLSWLKSQQGTDGGFPYQAGSSSDPDSTALVVQAILATGGDPAAPRWSVGRQTPVTWLVSRQDRSGGYVFPGNKGADVFTTAQVPVALERVTFPVPFSSRSFYQPGAQLTSSSQPPPPPSTPPGAPPPVSGVVTPPATGTPQLHAGAVLAHSLPAAHPSAAAAPGVATSPGAAASPGSGVQGLSSPSPSPGGTAPILSLPVPLGLPAPLLYVGAALLAAAGVAGGSLLLARRA